VAVDLAAGRLDAAKQFGADIIINSRADDPLTRVMELTGGLGADVAGGLPRPNTRLGRCLDQSPARIRPTGTCPPRLRRVHVRGWVRTVGPPARVGMDLSA